MKTILLAEKDVHEIKEKIFSLSCKVYRYFEYDHVVDLELMKASEALERFVADKLKQENENED